jgi:hypothetical protein
VCLLVADNLQFCLKKNLGCSNVMFTVCATADFYDSGSNVYIVVLDFYQACAHLIRLKLFNSLIKTGLPLWFVNSYFNKLVWLIVPVLFEMVLQLQMEA